MATWHTAAAITILGLGVLASGRLQPAGTAGAVAVVVPPWRPGGLAFAAESGLPIIDIRWAGRLVVLDAGADPGAMAGLGPFVLAASGPFGCATGLNG